MMRALKVKRSHLAVLAVFVIALGLHGMELWRFEPPTGHFVYEGPQRQARGDADYYLDGATSLLDFWPAKKFNNKREPIIGKTREIKSSDFPSWAPYVLFAYPYPSFKFGYSDLATLVTLPFNQQIFVRTYSRLGIANYIFNVATAVLIFVFCLLATGRIWPGLFGTLFFLFDYSNIYNSYGYLAHTTPGLTLFFLGIVLLGYDIARNRISVFRFGLAAFILSFCEVTTSHLIVEAGVAGLIAWVRAMMLGPNLRARLMVTLAGVVGAAIVPGYIMGVEWLFDFHRLGLPTYLAQINAYAGTVGILIATYPWYGRQIWDLRLFNPFMPVIGLTILVVIARYFFVVRSERAKAIAAAPSQYLRTMLSDPASLIVIPFIVGVAIAAVYSQPISRAETAHLVLAEVIVAVVFGKLSQRINYFAYTGAAVILLSAALGTMALNRALDNESASVSAPWRNVPKPDFVIQEHEAVGSLATEYYKHMGHWIVPSDRYRYINKPLGSFLDEIEANRSRFFGSATIPDDKAWVSFDAMELVFTYASMRRFWPQFVPKDARANLVTTATYKKDFKLIMDMFSLMDSGALKSKDAFKLDKLIWPFRLWDMEYHYTLGYLGGVRPLLKGTPIENIDMHAIYYFNVGALRRAEMARAK